MAVVDSASCYHYRGTMLAVLPRYGHVLCQNMTWIAGHGYTFMHRLGATEDVPQFDSDIVGGERIAYTPETIFTTSVSINSTKPRVSPRQLSSDRMDGPHETIFHEEPGQSDRPFLRVTARQVESCLID